MAPKAIETHKRPSTFRGVTYFRARRRRLRLGWKFYAETKGLGHCSRWPRHMSEVERKFREKQGDLFVGGL